MSHMNRALVMVAVLGPCFGFALDDVTVPLDGGELFIRAEFIKSNVFSTYYPELTLRIRNHTTSPWGSILMRIDAGLDCGDKPRQISFLVDELTVGWRSEGDAVTVHDYVASELKNQIDGCSTDKLEIYVVRAKKTDGTMITPDIPGSARDMTEELKRAIDSKLAEALAEEQRLRDLKSEEDRLRAI